MLTAGGSQGKLVSERRRPGSARSAFQAAQAASTTASWPPASTRWLSQRSRRYSHTRSTGLNSGRRGGGWIRVRFAGAARSSLTCQPAPSSTSAAWVPAGTVRDSSARNTPMAAVETSGSTSATPLPRSGHTDERPERRLDPVEVDVGEEAAAPGVGAVGPVAEQERAGAEQAGQGLEVGEAALVHAQPLPAAPGRPALARAGGRGRAVRAPVLLPQRGLRPTDLRRAPARAARTPRTTHPQAGRGPGAGRGGARGRGRRAPARAPGHAGERGHGAALGPGPAAARAGAAARRRRGRLGGAQGAHLRHDPGGPRAAAARWTCSPTGPRRRSPP